MVECLVLDEISSQLEEKRSKEEKSENDMLTARDVITPTNEWDADKLLMIGIVAAIVILSCAVLVYAARH